MISLVKFLGIAILVGCGYFAILFSLIKWGSIKLVFDKKLTVIEAMAAGMMIMIIAIIVAGILSL